MTRVFKTKPFARFANRERIPDHDLYGAVVRAETGPISVKERASQAASEASILFRRGALAFFVFGFAKKDRDNITSDELRAFRRLADEILALDDPSLVAALKNGTITEIQTQ